MSHFSVKRDTNSVLENGSVAGNVLLNDASANQVTQIKAGTGSYVPVPGEGATIQGTYGFLTIMPDGSYFYTASTAQADGLRNGATASDTFTYFAVDSIGRSGSNTLKFTVTGVNDAPVLSSTSTSLTTITEDQTTNSGQTVASFLNSTDADSSALRGIAITGLTSANGQWQYSTNGGTSWSAVGTVTDGSALLLRSSDLVRFIPNGANGTTADFTYRAWDQTSGVVGTKVDATTNGGQTAFSTAIATASIVVSEVNDAPVGVASSASGTEDGPPITGQVQATDVDHPTLTYTLVADSAVGGTVTIDPLTGDYSFIPAENFSGTGSFRFTASDGSLSTSPTLVTIAIAGVNDAPVLTSTSTSLTTITEDQTTNSGQTVASFLSSTDADTGALRGIAITGLTSANGEWQVSTNGGTTWSAVGTVTDGAALLLRSTDYIRFVPNGVNGTTADFTYRAWDQTSGLVGTKVDATTNGGQTAFSTATGTASIVVSEVNDAPVGVASSASGIENGPPITGQVQATDVDNATLTYALVADSAVGGTVTIDPLTGDYSFTPAPDVSGTASFQFTASDGSLSSTPTLVTITIAGINDAPVLTSTSASLTTITEDQTTNGGQTIASFLSSTDADAGALRGIAITGLSSGNGEWQVSTNGGTSWSAVGVVADDAALLLRSTDRIRFVPNGVNGTTADFTYRAWDQTSGAVGSKVDATINGGETAFSTATGTASIVVSSVNDAPVGVASSASGTEDGPPITGQVQATDVDHPTLTYALVAGSAVGGAVSIDPLTGDYSFTPAPNFSGTGSFRFTASDGSLNSSPTTVTITVAGINDAPVAVDDSGITEEDTPILLDVLDNDTDVDGNPLSITAVGGAANGTVQIENGQVRYSPNAGFVGEDSFTYTISDGAGGTSQASADVAVEEGNVPSAFSITFRQGANGYFGAVDTVLRQNRSSTSYPDAVVFRPTTESGKEAQPLLRFDGLFGTGPGQIPVGSLIISATLTLQITGESSAGGTINRMLVGWNGNSTWNSMGSGVSINGTEATSSGAVTVGSVALGSRVFDVTNSLVAWNAAGATSAQQNAANLGWVFKPSSSDVWDFMSSNGAVQPVLTITYTHRSTAPTMPTVSISAGAPAAENNGTMTFSLSLSQAATKDVTVSFSTVDHTAKAGSDYVGTVQSLTFLPGETTKSFTVGLINNAVGERQETFTVQLDSAINARINAAVATGRIIDDDVSVAPVLAINETVVAVHNISNATNYPDGSGSYGISDPSALAYVPSLGALFIADSEHDESPFNSNTNLFSIRPDGSFIGNHSLMSFTDEPTGLAYNSSNGLLYVADDDHQAVYWVSPTNPSVKLGSFDTARLGFVDTEDLKFDPLTGNIHILDGLMKQIFELTPQGVFVNSVPLPSVMQDAEALAYDFRHDVFFVASGVSALIWIVNPQGAIVGTIDVLTSYSTRPKIKGLELAPSSNPNDGNTLSLYVADYGSDQQNDGRLFEINLGSDWFF